MIIDTMEKLEAIYTQPIPPAAKATTTEEIIPPFAKLIEASPFFLLATVGPEGVDCSAKGDPNGFVHVQDSKTLVFPDRAGNNKIESLRNIVRDPRASLLFLIPGTGTIFRVNGKASISIDETLRSRFTMNGALPKSVVIVKVELAYLQCSRALMRSRIWDPTTHINPKAVPSTGDILAFVSNNKEGGKAFDEAATDRMARTLW